MKNSWQIIFGGVGGQGLMLAGEVLGAAATEVENRKAVMTSSYGVETRGTFAKSDVIVSDGEIDFPEVLCADAVVVLAAVAYVRYASVLPAGSLLLCEASIKQPPSAEDPPSEEVLPSVARQIRLPILETARQVGSPNCANIVSLGILIGILPVVAPESVEEALRGRFSGASKLFQVNLDAFRAGIKLAKWCGQEGCV